MKELLKIELITPKMQQEKKRTESIKAVNKGTSSRDASANLEVEMRQESKAKFSPYRPVADTVQDVECGFPCGFPSFDATAEMNWFIHPTFGSLIEERERLWPSGEALKIFAAPSDVTKKMKSNIIEDPSLMRQEKKTTESLNAVNMVTFPRDSSAKPEVEMRRKGMTKFSSYPSDEDTIPISGISETGVENASSDFTKKLKSIVVEDASLILSMERTLFAALQHCWMFAFCGVGLMSVGNGDQYASFWGTSLMVAGMVGMVISVGMHFWRIDQIKTGRGLEFNHTIVFTGILVVFTVVALGLELYFGILYPYLERSRTVTLSNQAEILP